MEQKALKKKMIRVLKRPGMMLKDGITGVTVQWTLLQMLSTAPENMLVEM